MSMYVLTRAAERDLEDILDYIADRDGPRAAMYVYDALVHAFGLLASAPGVGRALHYVPGRLRCWTVFDYIVVYDNETSPLEIIRVIHGARDLGNLLRDL